MPDATDPMAALAGPIATALGTEEMAAVAPLVRLMAELWTLPVPAVAFDEVFDAAWADDDAH